MNVFRSSILGFFIMLLMSCSSSKGQSAGELIHLNQVGFYPDAPKKAAVEQDIQGVFYLVTDKNKNKVFADTLDIAEASQYGDIPVTIADFSAFNESGTYRLLIPGLGHSHPFKIGSNIYAPVADASLKGYYFQRASTPLPRQWAGKWNRKAGHHDDSVIVHASAATAERPEGTVISSPKGWYDAGDYNKYVVNSGITTATLLSLYEDFSQFASQIAIGIPEQNNNLPDLLDEVLWNIRWMLTMQDPHDGGVYHKMTSPGFSGMVMPHEDTDARYVVQKSTAATLDFAAVMAQAARVFADYDKPLRGLADSCLTAAKRAWQWAQQHPRKLYKQNKLNQQFDPNITTGAYGDDKVADEFYWAGIELYIATGKQQYINDVRAASDNGWVLPSWSNVRALGYYSLLRFRDKLEGLGNQEIPKVKRKLLLYANSLLAGQQRMAYETVMGADPDHFIWGSNSVAGNQGIALITAYNLTSERRYLDGALSNLDYLLGRNATGFSFLTGYGDQTPGYPHHRPSEADEISEPVPGLLVGGPNPDQQDGCKYPSGLPNKSYVDTVCSYASNEIAINWNAPMVYLTYAMEALQYKAGYAGKSSF